MSRDHQYFVYILASRPHGTLYIGVTNDLKRRVWQHKEKQIEGFTKKYNIAKLVYYEATTDVEVALNREKRLKKWKRDWKKKLIMEKNPMWKDLYEDL